MYGEPIWSSIDAKGLTLNLGISIIFIGGGKFGTSQSTYLDSNYFNA